jgi:hypothetical protein
MALPYSSNSSKQWQDLPLEPDRTVMVSAVPAATAILVAEARRQR